MKDDFTLANQTGKFPQKKHNMTALFFDKKHILFNGWDGDVNLTLCFGGSSTQP